LEKIFENKDFNNGNFDINFLGKFLKKTEGKKDESSREFEVYIWAWMGKNWW
jgi:hypothetical protein